MSCGDHPLIAAMASFETYCLANSAAHVRLSRAGSAIVGPFALPATEPPTVYHTRDYVSLPLPDLAASMQQALRCSDEMLAAALALCCRYAATTSPVTWHMLHRLYVAALHTALKTHSDGRFPVSFAAAAAGVDKREIVRLESRFFHDVGYRAHVLLSRDELARANGNTMDAICVLALTDLEHALRADAPQPGACDADAAEADDAFIDAAPFAVPPHSDALRDAMNFIAPLSPMARLSPFVDSAASA